MIPRPLMRFLERLRFPYLFVVMLVLLAADLLMPDPFPFVDELLLAVGTLLLASIRKRKTESEMTLEAQEENVQ